jgi:branched-chain amino acid transport system substrate-binding protein
MLDQPHEFPWSMAYTPSYETEAHIYAQYLLETHPRGKIAILYQDDGFGKDHVKGLKDRLGGKIPIVAEIPFKVTDPTIEPLIAKLQASGADILFDATTPKFTGMAIKRAAELGWKPLHIVSSASKMISAVVPAAGLRDAEGLLSASFALEGDDPLVANDPVYRDWAAFVDRYIPSASKANSLVVTSYVLAKMMVEVLTRCGDDLSRENIMRQANSLKGLPLPMLVPGIVIDTGASDHAPIEQMRMIRFSGERWEQFGPVRSGVDAGSVSESFKTIFQYATAKRDLANKLNANTVSLMTGSFGSTYAQIGADLASVLDNGENLRVLPVLGRGSVQAVADVLLLRGVDAGIVRKDTLAYLERKDFASNIRNQFVYVAKMFNEEMHVLAPRTVRSMKDLNGRTVVVDLPDSSTFVTAINVFERLGIKPHLLYIEPRLALDMLRKGEVDAIVAVEGKPLQWMSQIRDENCTWCRSSTSGLSRMNTCRPAFRRRIIPIWFQTPIALIRSPAKRFWRPTIGLRTTTAIAALPCWWIRFSHKLRGCSSRRSIRSGKRWR